MATIDLNFNKKLFNPLFWELQEDLKNPDIRLILVYGGSSASKTYTIAQSMLIELLNGKNTMILRKYSTDIKDSIYSDFKQIIETWDINSFIKTQQNIIKLSDNNYIRFRGLDDSEKIKGLSSFTYLW